MAVSQTPDAARRRRSDYRQNTEAILEAADELFAERGVRAPINAIAERAGVAPATLYRHFPTRQVLEDAVYGRRFDAYVEAIEDAQRIGEPVAAFRATVHAVVALQARDRSFREMIGPRTADDRFFDDPRLVRFAVALLSAMQRAQSDGVFRPGVREEDVLLLMIATEGVARPAHASSPKALVRFVDLALDGICAQQSAPAGEPLAWSGLMAVARG